MKYAPIVKCIEKVTKVRVPVLYNDKLANSGQGAMAQYVGDGRMIVRLPAKIYKHICTKWENEVLTSWGIVPNELGHAT